MDDIPSLTPVTMHLAGIVRPLPDGVIPPVSPAIRQFMVAGEVYQVSDLHCSALQL
jgi:hypothetical protein